VQVKGQLGRLAVDGETQLLGLYRQSYSNTHISHICWHFSKLPAADLVFRRHSRDISALRDEISEQRWFSTRQTG
jgi:hypothetical protein